MPRTLSEYRENPGRAIYITGEINQEMVDRLTPELLGLLRSSEMPLTVYIDSQGGSIYHARLLRRLLNSPSQDGKRCPVITVVTGMAASSAADLLAAGTYAIAYAHTVIHFHGVRTARGEITHEAASSLAEFLRESNEGFALDLAEQVLSRFILVYLQLRAGFPGFRSANANATDVECLVHFMTEKLGGNSELLELAKKKHQRLNRLLEYYSTNLAGFSGSFGRPAEKEAFLLKSLIDWELQENPSPEWRLGSEGTTTIMEDFALLADYESGQHMRSLESHIREWGQFLLEPEQRKHYDTLTEEGQSKYLLDTTRERFRAVWHFLVSVCRALQQGENRLSAHDAYWLGVVDEVPGSNLHCIREVLEKQNDVQKPKRARVSTVNLDAQAVKAPRRRSTSSK